MRINIASPGRFHLMDLARELEKQGHHVRFYSYLPNKRCIKFGLKRECCYSLFWLMLPVLACMKWSHRADWTTILQAWVLDHLVSWFMKPCDVFIGISDLFDYSFMRAKKKFNAVTIVERGSKHVLAGTEIFIKNPALKGQKPYPDWLQNRELHNYEICDYISIPSDHVRRSFLKYQVPEEKLLVNPYGVDLEMFSPAELSKEKIYDIVFVGRWCWRKGCDLLTVACRDMNLSLLHAGGITDVGFPDTPEFLSVGHVEQWKLAGIYSRGKIFVLPSREEGLSLVQAQALACGLPLVCSQDTGGRDLKPLIDDPKWIVEMKEFSLAELERCIKKALELADTQKGIRSIINREYAREHLSWEAYGKRYNEQLLKIMDAKR